MCCRLRSKSYLCHVVDIAFLWVRLMEVVVGINSTRNSWMFGLREWMNRAMIKRCRSMGFDCRIVFA